MPDEIMRDGQPGADNPAGDRLSVQSDRPGPPPLPRPPQPASNAVTGPTPANSYDFLDQAGLSRRHIEAVLARAAMLGATPQRVLFHEGHITPERYVAALARDTGVRAARRQGDLPSGALGIDATGQNVETVREAIRRARAAGRTAVLFIGTGERSIDPDEPLARTAVQRAVTELREARPVASAGRRMWFWQFATFTIAMGLAIGTALMAPGIALTLALLASAIVFALIVTFRLVVLSAAVVSSPPWSHRGEVPGQPERALPDYTVLVPLYREAAVLPDLVEALSNLDYPAAKLEVAIILEESDRETRDAADRLALPPFMRLIVVPDRQPRTKPKALDMALALTRGDLVAVYDAEDVPDRDQLRRAVNRFGPLGGRYHCAQARLSIHNAKQSWLTRHFTLEYAALFQALLPGLVRLGLPVPLSGTSNHFPRRVLNAEPWDPFNVTEDADLGIRLARRGGRIGLIDSDTWEEAPYRFGQWLPQRTRWIKGWMQTWLVHTREPFRLLRELGVWRAFGFHALIGGFLVSVLSYPIMLAALIIELCRTTPFETVPGSLHHIAMTIALTDAGIGFAAAIVMLVIGARRARLQDIAGNIATAPIYWLLISVAGWRALVQLIHKPHLWEKTEHHARR